MARLEHYATVKEAEASNVPAWFRHFWNEYEKDVTDDNEPHPTLGFKMYLFIPQASEQALYPELDKVEGIVVWAAVSPPSSPDNEVTIAAIQVFGVEHPNYSG